MSALGQKQTCAAQYVMSALPPKADMCGATRDVRFVPIADIYIAIFARSQRHNDQCFCRLNPIKRRFYPRVSLRIFSSLDLSKTFLLGIVTPAAQRH